MPKTSFKVLPAVDLMKGRVVRLVQGRAEEVSFEAPNPLEVARRWISRGAKALHVVDLDGSFEGRLRHESIIKEIISLGVEVQVGGGIRDLKVAERLLTLGASRVILGTLAVKEIDAVRDFAKRNPEKVMIAIDTKNWKVAIKGWTEESDFTPIQLAKVYEDLEVSFLFTNVDVEGKVEGIDRKKVLEILENVKRPVYVAGGFSSFEDVKFAKDAGAAGVVIGSALYTGKLKFEDVLKIQHEEEKDY